TYLNESRLEGEAKLRDGDRLRVGTTVVCFESSAPPLPAGTKIGPYELQGVAERREGLTVHDAHHAGLSRQVHVELLDEGDKHAPAFLARARAASAYDHPVLLAVFDAGEQEGRAYRIVEAWPDARELEERLREGRLPTRFALGVAQQVAAGLAYIHAKGGVHGWLTPRIVRVDETGAAKLEVVGGDKLIRLDPSRRDARLQALSISPEEARGLDATARSDVYALGCVLFRALTGVPPFDGELAQVIRSHAGETSAPRLAPRDPSLSGEIDELCARLLAKKADGRPSADEASKELADLAQRAGDAEPPKAPLKKSAGTWGAVKSDPPPKPAPAPAPLPPAPAPPKKEASARKPKTQERPIAKLVEPKIVEAPTPPDEPGSEDTDEVPREIITSRLFDPVRAGLLGVVFFLLFFLSSQATMIALRILKK
ncbi:MAG: protein kinase, partial [Planctomycetota bacterium]